MAVAGRGPLHRGEGNRARDNARHPIRRFGTGDPDQELWIALTAPARTRAIEQVKKIIPPPAT